MRLAIRGLMLTATAASGQSAGSFEVSGFGRYPVFDDTQGLNDRFGGGGGLGFYLLRNLALEAEGSYLKTSTTLGGIPVTNIPIRGRLTYHVPLGGNASALRLGVGYVRDLYRDGVSFDNDGVTKVLGFRWGI